MGGDTTWSVVKWFDTLSPNDPWKTYRIGASTNDLVSIDNSMGLWVYITALGSDSLLTVQGTVPVTTDINLYTGWNLVSFPASASTTADLTLPGAADLVANYNGASPYLMDQYSNLALVTMNPGEGYWVHVTSDTVWTVTY